MLIVGSGQNLTLSCQWYTLYRGRAVTTMLLCDHSKLDVKVAAEKTDWPDLGQI